MSGAVDYPVVPLEARGEIVEARVTVEPRTGAMAAEVLGRSFSTQPAAGRRRLLDTGFLELRKVLRRAGYRLQTCGTCEHFRYAGSSREMSAGLTGYCGLGHHELGSASLGPTSLGGQRAPVVTLLYSCPDWSGRDERELAAFFRADPPEPAE